MAERTVRYGEASGSNMLGLMPGVESPDESTFNMKLKKATGAALALIAIANLLLFLFRITNAINFWIVVAVLAAFAWLVLPRMK